jgi:hypothetical protein
MTQAMAESYHGKCHFALLKEFDFPGLGNKLRPDALPRASAQGRKMRSFGGIFACAIA